MEKGTNELPIEAVAELYQRDTQEVREAYEEWAELRKSRQRPAAPDIRLLATLAGLSTTSVSNYLRSKPGALSSTNAERLGKLIDLVGYVPSSAAQSLRGLQTYIIGIVLPLSSVSPDFYMEILGGIKQEADILGYQQFIFNVTSEEERQDFFANMPFLGIVDGLIVIGLHIDDSRLRVLENYNLPITIVHNRITAPPVVSNLAATDEEPLYELIHRHLIRQHGYRRICLVTLPSANPLRMGDSDRPDWVRAGRINAYLKALETNQIEYDPQLVIEVNEHSYQEGYRAYDLIQELNEGFRDEQKIDAVVCTSDTLASGIITAAGRHSEPIPVTGFDNLPVAELLDITTVDQRAREVGRLSFRQLYNALSYQKRKGEYPTFVEEGINMKVIIRSSCGCVH
jgi:DNA-binding LacI/PurR family transcriptional regulator